MVFCSSLPKLIFLRILMLLMSIFVTHFAFGQNVQEGISETDSLPPEVAAYVRQILAEEDSIDRMNRDYAPLMPRSTETSLQSLDYEVSFATCTLSPAVKSAHIHISCQQYMEEVNILGTDGEKHEIPIIYYPNSIELDTKGLASGEYVVLIQLEKSIFTKNIWVK